ncbi:3'-5' exonuclease [Opitutus sp. ER46]|uniref:3'-5' exonuclease n=1 Tax=Opitutus sp. ER46 TaxID=2161864 RepID=UPI001E48C6AE|nr:3'-5' exonuclease [Opitutus sp. ER46]
MLAVGTSWTEQPIFFVDFEGNQTSGVLEFGVATLLRGEVIEARTRLCRPVGEVRAADVAVHGLAAEQLVGAEPFADEWEYFASLRERGPLAAHYAGVENSLIKAAWPYPRSSPDFARPGERVFDWGPWIDTARLYAQLFPNLESGRLESLIEVTGLSATLDALAERHCPPPRRHFHAALYDALAGAVLLGLLACDPQTAGLTTMQMLALSTLDPRKRQDLQQRELF